MISGKEHSLAKYLKFIEKLLPSQCATEYSLNANNIPEIKIYVQKHEKKNKVMNNIQGKKGMEKKGIMIVA